MAGNDFASVFSSAFAVPEMPGGAGEIPGPLPFGGGRGYGSVGTGEDGKIPGATRYDFLVKRRVFLIYRPWERCQRCLDDVANNAITLPTEGDHQCPHQELLAYESVVNSILDGTYLFGSESEIANKDGSVSVSLRWYEPLKKQKNRVDPLSE